MVSRGFDTVWFKRRAVWSSLARRPAWYVPVMLGSVVNEPTAAATAAAAE